MGRTSGTLSYQSLKRPNDGSIEQKRVALNVTSIIKLGVFD
jgi:hypothetical protein